MTSQILFTIATLLLSADCEALFFNDGHLEIENPLCNFEEDSTLPRSVLMPEQARNLYKLFNRPEIQAFFEQ
jgi:hypothetical protein